MSDDGRGLEQSVDFQREAELLEIFRRGETPFARVKAGLELSVMGSEQVVSLFMAVLDDPQTDEFTKTTALLGLKKREDNADAQRVFEEKRDEVMALHTFAPGFPREDELFRYEALFGVGEMDEEEEKEDLGMDAELGGNRRRQSQSGMEPQLGGKFQSEHIIQMIDRASEAESPRGREDDGEGAVPGIGDVLDGIRSVHDEALFDRIVSLVLPDRYGIMGSTNSSIARALSTINEEFLPKLAQLLVSDNAGVRLVVKSAFFYMRRDHQELLPGAVQEVEKMLGIIEGEGEEMRKKKQTVLEALSDVADESYRPLFERVVLSESDRSMQEGSWNFFVRFPDNIDTQVLLNGLAGRDIYRLRRIFYVVSRSNNREALKRMFQLMGDGGNGQIRLEAKERLYQADRELVLAVAYELLSGYYGSSNAYEMLSTIFFHDGDVRAIPGMMRGLDEFREDLKREVAPFIDNYRHPDVATKLRMAMKTAHDDLLRAHLIGGLATQGDEESIRMLVDLFPRARNRSERLRIRNELFAYSNSHYDDGTEIERLVRKALDENRV